MGFRRLDIPWVYFTGLPLEITLQMCLQVEVAGAYLALASIPSAGLGARWRMTDPATKPMGFCRWWDGFVRRFFKARGPSMNGKKFRNPIDKVMVYLLAMFWVVPPSHEASHHQDTWLGGRGSPNPELHLPLLFWRGTTLYVYIYIYRILECIYINTLCCFLLIQLRFFLCMDLRKVHCQNSVKL